ncbi:MAG TPA: hypothetical protein VNO50_23475 [Pyrinomonadaceae bacterium]|nr:hypothetical protein [Pyrinomonadaceae bacterium]
MLPCLMLACEQSAKGRSTSSEEDFERKRACAEAGRVRLEEETRKEHQDIEPLVSAHWCYSTTLNTCIYESDKRVVIRNPKSPNERPQMIFMSRSAVDLLTNQTLFGVVGENESPEKHSDYAKKLAELFKTCQ